MAHNDAHPDSPIITADFEYRALIQCLIAAAHTRGLPSQGPGDFHDIARHLDTEDAASSWHPRLVSAEKLHEHFLNRSLDPAQLQDLMLQTRTATLQLIAALRTNPPVPC